jgi:hypothetical protein
MTKEEDLKDDFNASNVYSAKTKKCFALQDQFDAAWS